MTAPNDSVDKNLLLSHSFCVVSLDYGTGGGVPQLAQG